MLLTGAAAAPAPGASPVPEMRIHPALKEAKVLFEKREWDAAELSYLKAAESPRVEDRIQAYEGLQHLYKKIRLSKKAFRAARALEEEKKFVSRLIPDDSSSYEIYTVKKGDAYSRIAVKRRISVEWLTRANGGKVLKVGDKIRIPRYRDRLVVDKKEKKMYWLRGKKTVKIYPVSVGRVGSETPEGEFEVVSKVAHPVWYWEKKVIPADSPQNLLGTRWLGLNHKGYGIHGTRNPESIGAARSHGCIRMHNKDVEEIFPWIPQGTKVIIHDGHRDVPGA